MVIKKLTCFWKNLGDVYNKTGFVIFTIVHFLIGFIYANSLENLSFINDPKDFYEIASSANSWFSTFGIGHEFIAFLIYPLVKLGISLELLFFTFTIISYKGFLIYIELIGLKSIKGYNKILLLLFFLPTMHIWSASLSKEALILYLMAVILKYATFNKNNIKLVLALVMVFLIRPHMFFIILLALFLGFVLNNNYTKRNKTKIVLISVVFSFFFVFCSFKYYFEIENLSIESIVGYVDYFYSHRIQKQLGGSAINILDTSIFQRIFYLLFMPLPYIYNIKNIFQLCVAIENSLLLISLLGIVFIFFKKKKNNNLSLSLNSYIIGVVSISIVFFASYLYNLGLGNRMRLMFLPYLFFLIVKTIDFNNLIKSKN